MAITPSTPGHNGIKIRKGKHGRMEEQAEEKKER
jgi:hypothetical protein